ncbi:MAG: acyl-CoA/acyl-ACP dehydrogenase [Deltaproteobacteria bacterium]|nr:acyl-CoA/acyl-ACP dehydrogenase [Deltaproteobacteria bacterium]
MQPKDYGFGEDERILRDSARRFLDEVASIDKVRKLVAADHGEAYESATPPARYDGQVWQKMVDLGWTALAVPESAGGVAMKCVAVAALAEEIGRRALPSPLLSTLFSTFVLREAEAAAARPWLEKIVGGAGAALAITNEEGSWEPARTGLRAQAKGDQIVLDGTAHFVQDARKASFFVVSAASDGGVALYAVAAEHPGVTIHPDHIVDLTRDQARVAFDRVSIPAAAQIAPGETGVAVLRSALPAMLTVLAADMTGAAEWQLQTTTAYAKVRHQFDHPLGFFQAVKHPIVNMMVAIDETRSLVYNAACAIDGEPELALRYARMAKSSASDTAAFCSGRSVQLHGGIGFTWECDVQIYFKRQRHSQMLLGDGVYQREKLAELL